MQTTDQHGGRWPPSASQITTSAGTSKPLSVNVTDIARPAIALLFNKGACVGGIYKRPGYTKGTRPKLAFSYGSWRVPLR